MNQKQDRLYVMVSSLWRRYLEISAASEFYLRPEHPVVIQLTWHIAQQLRAFQYSRTTDVELGGPGFIYASQNDPVAQSLVCQRGKICICGDAAHGQLLLLDTDF